MTLRELKPRLALNKAYLKVKPNRLDMERFKSNLIQLLDRTNDTESEEFHKNLVSDFLKKTYYEPNHFINTKGRNDLVIHNGDKASSSVGVVIEAKKPTNKSEMVSANNINKKAFQELVLYYLRERITHKNLEVKYLIITNINEWFVFDATTFDRLFAQNNSFVKQFNDFEEGRLADTKTDFFYKQIAEPFIAKLTAEIEFTHFNIQDYQKPLRNDDPSDDHKLIVLFKLLSPEHLLKQPFANDSNSLDKRFYSELLHIIGLTETKEGGKKLIQRNKEGERYSGSILEDAIIQIDGMDKLSRLDKPNQFGSNSQERLFNVALELSITWINRILFLKLLEAQLMSYHKFDKHNAGKNESQDYAFLNFKRIKNYDDLNTLFFQVLARKHEERNDDVKNAYERVPYLNSSLFEPTEIEHATLFISNLKDEKTIPIISTTVLKNEQGKKRSGAMSTLQYLFEFLDAYDFGAEGDDEIQEDNKPLINASVLGLIFEKINGYKDGSFFTPGFITMYMCRETIRKAVVQKFNETKQWNCQNFDDLYDKIEDRSEANQIVNSIKICDPAVGSGHFLVSALNEIIAVKNDLKILQDREGKRLKEYHVEVVNDELTVTDDEGDLFQYKPGSTGSPGASESQRIQETLFHEKQTIIENCLFGVDINPNSVKICRLRLWIELLKNAYYETEHSPFGGGQGGGLQPEKRFKSLQTLPNIDINIKCGNSLVSRFAIDADLSTALKKSKWTIDSYRSAVATYRNAESKEQKREMERLIADIKSDFRSEISLNDPKLVRKRKIDGELFMLTNQQQLFEMERKEKAAWNKKVDSLTAESKKLENEIEEIKANKIFENAFEWRFEFPEVLDNDGKFVGFDVVIGNPPYMRIQELNEFKNVYKEIFNSAKTGNYDIYVLFLEKSLSLIRQSGVLQFILPHKFIIADFGKGIREILKEANSVDEIIHFGEEMIFEEATTYTCLLVLTRRKNSSIKYVKIKPTELTEELKFNIVPYDELSVDSPWFLDTMDPVFNRLNKFSLKLEDVIEAIFSGIQTSADSLYIIYGTESKGYVHGKVKGTGEEIIIESGILKRMIKGDDIKRYSILDSTAFVIFPYYILNSEAIPYDEKTIASQFPNAYKYLLSIENELRYRENGKMDINNKWFLYNYPKNLVLSNSHKLVSPDITFKLNITRDVGDFCLKNGAYGIKIKENFKKYELALIGILNSELMWYFLQKTGNVLRGGYFRFNKKYILPFPWIENNMFLQEISCAVDKIFEIKQDPSADTTALESQIDALVYALYGLSEEEIKIVEGNL